MTTGVINLSALDLSHLQTTGKWARFLSIVSMVFLGLMLIGSLVTVLGGGLFNSFAGGIGSELGVLIYAYLLIGVLYVYPTIQLYSFGNSILKAAQNSDREAATTAFKSLKRLFVFVGILTAVIIAFYVLATVGAIFFATGF